MGCTVPHTQEFQAILAWGLDTYFRHYKLFQYAFTDRCGQQQLASDSDTQLHPICAISACDQPHVLPWLHDAVLH